MADDFVQLGADGTGKKVDASSLVIGANTVERQRVALGSNLSGTGFAGVLPMGRLQISDEPSQLFYDPFDGGVIDTTTRWTSANAGGGVAPSAATGLLTVGTGTTANGYSSLTSIPTFGYPSPSWLGTSAAVQFEASPIANSYRFFGFGTSPGTPTAAAPLTDAIGFEIATTGKMFAVMYNAGVRTVIQDMSAATGNATQPTDGAYHRWVLFCRIDRIYWCIDTIEVPVATSNFNIPNSQILPIKMLAIAGSTAPASSAVLSNGGWSVWDTGRNNVQISDGTYPYRKLTVKPASTAPVATDTAIVMALHPSAALPAGEGHVGEVGGNSATPSASFTRPANTTAYTIGALVANSVTAGSVAAMSLTAARKVAGTGRIARGRLSKTSTGTTGAVFRVHLYRTAPTLTSLTDAGTYSTNNAANYIGALDFDLSTTTARAFTDGVAAQGVPSVGPYILFDCAAGVQTLIALIEARGAYAPGSAETFTLTLECDRD